jgi:hypothetical protein
MAGASLAGLLFSTSFYPTLELREAFLTNDVVNLVIGLPCLLGSLVLARKGSLLGQLTLPGALLYTTYNYLVYTAAFQPGWQFALFTSLVLLSGWTLIRLISSLDRSAARQRLAGKVPERFSGGVLALFGVLFFLRGAWQIAQGSLAGAALATVIADLLITPLWVAGGVLLWRKHSLGYISGAGLLFQGSTLFLGLLVFFILQPFVNGTPFPVVDFAVVLSMGLVFFIPFGLFVRGLAQK